MKDKRYYLKLFSLLFLGAGCVLVTDPTRVLRAQTESAEAIFAGGCFWCMEKPFDVLDGVLSTTSGYTGGDLPNPSYEAVSSGRTGHTEAVQVKYDPARVSYTQLLDVFWQNIDPLDGGGQFCDRGPQYRSGIFYTNANQKELALQSKQSISSQLDGQIMTSVEPLAKFYAAEEYHQNYYDKNPIRYNFYRFNCRRDNRLSELWDE